ncbi:hypothetical protein TNCV_3141181 [Trichonephila clavipes]|nr:hypothetical protein TNCV_3141181 [Trichonephila clavipes]
MSYRVCDVEFVEGVPAQVPRSSLDHGSKLRGTLPKALGLVVRLFRVPTCRKGTMHLLTSMPSLGSEPRPYATTVRVTGHCTGWAVSKM